MDTPVSPPPPPFDSLEIVLKHIVLVCQLILVMMGLLVIYKKND